MCSSCTALRRRALLRVNGDKIDADLAPIVDAAGHMIERLRAAGIIRLIRYRRLAVGGFEQHAVIHRMLDEVVPERIQTGIIVPAPEYGERVPDVRADDVARHQSRHRAPRVLPVYDVEIPLVRRDRHVCVERPPVQFDVAHLCVFLSAGVQHGWYIVCQRTPQHFI